MQALSTDLIPFYTPALNDDGEVDFDLINSRIKAIVAVMFITLGVILAAAGSGSSLLWIPLIVSAAVIYLDYDYALDESQTRSKEIAETRQKDEEAVNEYLSLEKPSVEATNHIRSSLSAARLFAETQAQCLIDKPNAEKKRVLDVMPDYDVFTYLVDSYKKDLQDRPFTISYFERAAEYRDPAYLDYLVDNGIKSGGSFTTNKRHSMLVNAGCIKNIVTLCSFGFSIDTPDADGNTPLVKVLRYAIGDDTLSAEVRAAKFPLVEHVRALLDNNANPRAVYRSAHSADHGKNAFELCRQYSKLAEVKALLKKRYPALIPD